MRYRQLGRSGLTVSAVGLGCNNFGGSAIRGANGNLYGVLDLAETRAILNAAFDAGVTLYDTADAYGHGGSETFLGEVFKDRRHQVVIATKWGAGPDRETTATGSRRYIRQAVEASLRRLKTDYIDLYQHHWYDRNTPIEETLAALTEIVREGKVRYIGGSHFTGWQIADCDWVSRANGFERYISAQNHYNLLERDIETDVIASCERFGVGVLPYFPLANGLLTGKHMRGAGAQQGSNRQAVARFPDAMFDKVDALSAFARSRGRSLLEVAIAGLAAQPAVSSVIAGASRPEQITANARAIAWAPTPQDVADLRALLVSIPA